MYSATYQKDVADLLFELGANYFIKKPLRFKDTKKAIERALCFVSQNALFSPTRADFVITN